MQIRLGGEWRTPTQCRVRFNGAWRRIAAIKMYAGGAWRTVATFSSPSTGGSSGGGSTGGSTGGSSGGSGGGGTTTMTAVASPDEASGVIMGGFAETNRVTATPTGGTAPYTYAWTVVKPSSAVATAPTSATTKFSRTGTLPGGATAYCTVTDAVGRTAVTNNVAITFEVS